MKPKIAILLLCTCFLSTAGFAAPPKVVKVYPENGAVDVAPGPMEIRIVFDQDMTTGKSYSICGGGENFPEIVGPLRWLDKRTFAFEAALKPNHDYFFGVNSRSVRNFKSASGEPAEVLVVKFKTAGGRGQLSRKENRKAIDTLRAAIDNHYSYKELKNLDWDHLFAQYEDQLLHAGNPSDFARTAGLLLAHAKDKHIWFRVDGRRVSAYRNRVTPNANFRKLHSLIPNLNKCNDYICTGRFPDGVGYLYVGNWNAKPEYYQPLYVALAEFADAPGLIIDVRGNGGGSEILARDFAGCFIDQPKVYAKHVVRDPDAPGGFTPVRERVLSPSKRGPCFKGKVAVLTGPVVISSCEAFVLMMKQVPGCILVGEPTQGSSGNPQPYDLGNGVTVMLPCWKALLPDGTCFEGIGIQPDISVKVRPEQITAADPVIDAARTAILRELNVEILTNRN